MKKAISILFLIIILISCTQKKFEYEKTDTGIVVRVNGLKKRITFFSSNTVRISVTKENNVFKDSSLAVIAKPAPVSFNVENNKNELIVKTDFLILTIDRSFGNISFMHVDSIPYLMELKNNPHILEDTIISNNSYLKIKQQFRLTSDEGIYGLGQFQNNIMNYRNHDIIMAQANRDAVVPMMVSTNNYGILWDNYSFTTFHDGKDGTSFSSKVADQIDYYFIGSSDIDGVISGYRTLTGKAPMFAKKAYGYWQSKER